MTSERGGWRVLATVTLQSATAYKPTRRNTAAHDTNAETLAGLWKTAGLEEERRGLFLMDAERRRLEAENQYRPVPGI